MKWQYRILGNHTHVKVYYNGAFCGQLTFRNEEFEALKATTLATLSPITSFEAYE